MSNRSNKVITLFLCAVLYVLTGRPLLAANTDIRLNSVGFLPNGPKLATLDMAASSFTVVNSANGVTAYSGGSVGAAFTDPETAATVQVLNFSSFITPGTYYLNVPGVGQSATFTIADDVYDSPLAMTMSGFLMWRCGQAVSCTYNGTTWSHAACHTSDGDTSLIGGGTKNGTGGWHDAGDYGKYTLNGAFAAGMLLQAWEQYGGNLSTFVLQMPSHTSGMPDYLTEVKYELDFLYKMQLANGSVADKLVPSGFPAGPSYTPPEILPENDTGTRYFVPASSHATASFCAIMAKAARIYQTYDAASAAKYLAAANSAYAWLEANPNGLWPSSGEGYCGDYTATTSGQLDDKPARLWAAAEVWAATGSATALADVEARIAARPSPVVDFNWDWGDPGNSASLGNLGIFTYLLNSGSQSGRNSALVASATADCISVANTIAANSQAHAYGRGLGKYYWGCNGTVARQVMNLMVANQLSPSATYTNAALAQLDHILGRNYYDRSYVTGLGINPPVNPHDRLSAADGITNPVPGRLVGGGWPNATSWVDAIDDYQYNEVALNWSAPVVYAEAAFCAPQKTPTATPTSTPTPCLTSYERINCGGTAAFTDHLNQVWVADQAYSVGTAGSYGYVTWAAGAAETAVTAAIANTVDDTLYQSGRWSNDTNSLEYRFNVSNGNYHVRLCFAEIYSYTGAGSRVFSVAVQGNTVAPALDIAGTVGQYAALDLVAPAVVSNGVVSVVLTKGSADWPKISAIELLQDNACPSPPSATVTPTATRTQSPTPTASATPSATASRTATASAMATISLTPSPSSSPTPSATAEPSVTASSSPTASASSTRSATATPSASSSVTPSRTASGSPSASPTLSASLTATLTSTRSASPTPSATAEPSGTISPTFTSVPPDSTPTVSPSASPTPSSSASPTATASASPSATGTPTPSSSASPTPSPSPTPSATAEPSGTPTASLTFTPSSTFTSVPPGSTATDSPTLTATPEPGSPAPGGEDPTLLKVYSLPNPVVPGLAPRLAVRLRGRASGLEIRAYTKNLVQALDLRLVCGLQPGWNTSPGLNLGPLPTGLSFLRVRAITASGQAGNWVLVPVMILR
jgi:endoglucanase